MRKLKLSITLLLVSLGPVMAQDFVEPFTEFISDRECYVITNDGEKITGYLGGATEWGGFVTRLRIRDEAGKLYKFKAQEVKQFAIRPGVLAKLATLADGSTSVRHAIQTDQNDILDREWIYFDAQEMPRRKNKIALLQLLNPGFDEHIKVYFHRNGSKSAPIVLANIALVGGEDRTYWVVKGDSKPEIVRKASYKKSFANLFDDEPDLFSTVSRRPKFKNFASHIQYYNELRSKSLISQK